MKKIFLLLSVFVIAECSLSFSQDYQTGIGLRGGWIGGITGKHFIKDDQAIEGIFSSGWGYRGYQITGLYEFHKEAFTKTDAVGFFWYYGGGLHFGGYSQIEWHPYYGMQNGSFERDHYSTFGIDGIFGLEYKIEDLPVTLSIDVKPFIEFSNYQHYHPRFWDAALSIRYVFGKKD